MEDLFMVVSVVGGYTFGACIIALFALLWTILENNNWRIK